MSIGVLSGFLTGFTLWSRQQRADRQRLFSSSPVRRLAALGYLRTQESEQTLALLREYVAWEPRPELRRRARRLMRRIERTIDRSIADSVEGAVARANALAEHRTVESTAQRSIA